MRNKRVTTILVIIYKLAVIIATGDYQLFLINL